MPFTQCVSIVNLQDTYVCVSECQRFMHNYETYLNQQLPIIYVRVDTDESNLIQLS